MKGKAEIVIGMQWGDEGKGRVVDALAAHADAVVRCQGGANAGSTVVANGQRYIFHLLPSGMLHEGKISILGNGTVIDPAMLFDELDDLSARGIKFTEPIISGAAHIVMPYHKIIDKLSEEYYGEDKIGTAKLGIGPCYADKYERIGIRAYDLINPDILRKRLTRVLKIKNEIITRVYGGKPFAFDEVFFRAELCGRRMKPMIADTYKIIGDMLESGKNILLEGAQAAMLDIDSGAYPYVTSSSPSAAGACAGAGIGPGCVKRVIGVAKSYSTRSGKGPMPTEESSDIRSLLIEREKEHSNPSGIPGRCGWFDVPAAKYAVARNSINGMALTKLDVFDDFDEIKICTAYEINGKITKLMPCNTAELEKAIPIYKSFTGWKCSIAGCRTFEELPQSAQNFVKFIEEETGVPILLIGVGPDRNESILRGI